MTLNCWKNFATKEILMKKTLLSLGFLIAGLTAWTQNPGLVISEFFTNPSGSDSPFEWIELRATATIDFSVTPYTVVVCNNGTATANGWVSSGTLSYAFAITTGVVNAGDVVYVGGSSMAPTGTKLRTINTATTAGDTYGSAAAGGVVGNGGANADGIAVFNLPVSSLTNNSVPVDAIFYGSALGSAVVNGGIDGYQLPVNDLYVGGKLQNNSFLAADPGGDQVITANGYYNTSTNTWGINRTWTVGSPVLDNSSSVGVGSSTPAGTISFSSVSQSITEGTASLDIIANFSNANNDSVVVALEYSIYSDALEGADFILSTDTLFIQGHTTGAQTFQLLLNDDALAEKTERVIIKLKPVYNAVLGANSFQIIHIKDNDYVAPAPSNELQLNLLTSFSNGAEGTNSAEIVAFDPTTDRLYIANSVGAKIDIVDFSNPAAPVLINSIAVTPYGNINSLTVHDGILAAAIENANPQMDGFVVFLDGDGVFISQVTVGAMPDMITFNNDFTKVLVACEGEPKTDYTIDPEGSIAIVDISGGVAALSASNVSIANFQAFNGQEVSLRAQGIRIFGPGSSAAQDFEPEYITISEDNSTAYVSLQENNAMAVVDIATATVTAIRPLGTMNYTNGNNALDASDQTSGIFIASAPVKGMFMPDAITHATIGGTEYIFSANEGDAREYAAYSEITRLSGANLDASIADQNILKHNQFLGRINITKASGDTDNDGDIDEIHVYGTRSFSIWNAQTGALVFDSKDLFEQITASHPTLSGLFNTSNSSGAATSKNRSDDKGPEPEGVTTAFINGNHYLFVGLERIGGVMIFNVDNPTTPVYVGYYNNRDVATNGPDRGAEGIITIKAGDSPNGKDLVILANEISSTLSVYEINTCVDLAGATLSVPSDSICAGDTVTLSIPGNVNSTYAWYKDNQVITNETGTSIEVATAGDYRVYVQNSVLVCADTTVAQHIQVLALPAVNAGTDLQICQGDTVILAATTAVAVTWNNGVQDGQQFVPTTTLNYIAAVVDQYNCENSDTVQVTINPLPSVNAGTDEAICAGEALTLTAQGASSYTWTNNVTNGQAFNPTIAGNYIVNGVDVNGCEDSDTLVLTIHANPVLNLGPDTSLCVNHLPLVLVGPTGYANYAWSNGTSSASTQVNQGGAYMLTVTDNNGCTDTDTIAVIAKPCLGLDELTEADFAIYPNPTANVINIKNAGGLSGVISIVTAMGTQLYTETLTTTGNTIDLTHFASGTYWILIQTEKGTYTQPLQKQ